ncbi:MAG: MFS transporter, partial [Anaerolineae bacterium]|nr:MFS transporter [Anaerolineae bacterium]
GSVGIGIINPVAPFLVAQYVDDASAVGMTLGWLVSIYAICQFIAAPGLGALSDRFGRRPILLICLLGSAVGYLLMGIGGALWVIFLGRIVDGITGGDISVIYAYIADITPPQDRSKFYGWVGAVFGIGFIIGPFLGGMAAKFGIAVPLYLAAAITFANVLYGLVAMPESLAHARRTASIQATELNPFALLANIFSIQPLRWLLLAVFLYSLPFAALQSNLGLFAKDSLGWDAAAIGLIFGLVGITDIIVQGLLLERLIRRFGETRVVLGGLLGELVSYFLIAASVYLASPVPLVAGTILFAMGDGLLGPSMTGLISRRAGARSQGMVQGGNQSIQSLARIIGPLLGGYIYDAWGHTSPYLGGAVIILLTVLMMVVTVPTVESTTLSTGEPSEAVTH